MQWDDTYLVTIKGDIKIIHTNTEAMETAFR